MKLEKKECKLFINKMIKQMNSILRYNTESILMCQIQNENNKMDFVILTKPMPVSFSIFNYINEIYVDNNIFARAIKHIPKSLIKHKIDSTSYAPMMISTQTGISLIDINTEDFENKEFVFPMKYNKYAEFSNTFFIIPDLFKIFINDHIIDGIDSNFHLYDENDCRYDTSGFLIPISQSSERAKIVIEKYSPNRFFPMKVSKEFNEEKELISNEIKNLLIKLNCAVCNFEFKDVVLNKDVIILSDGDTEFEIFNKKLKENGVTYIENKITLEKILIFDEFFKGKNKTIFVTSTRKSERLTDGTEVPTVYAGIVFKNKDIVNYLFYKYFEYDRGVENE